MLADEVGKEVALRLLEVFARECSSNREELERFAEQVAWPDIEVVAHRFKSSARQFGAIPLSDACLTLEELSRNPARDAEQLSVALDAVIVATGEALDVIRNTPDHLKI